MRIYHRIKQIGLKASWLKFKQLYLVPNPEVKDLCSRYGSYEYLKQYESACEKVSLNESAPKEKIIWTCWLQGEENAPLLVRRCIDSIRSNAGNFKVVVLTSETISNYISVPEHIIKKHETGIISHTHYTDFVRLLLLKKYGGIWIDATIMLTGLIPQYIIDSPLFVYKRRPAGNVEIETCFIVSDKNNPLICAVLELLLEYWRKENKLISYSLIHLAWTMAAHSKKEIKELWDNVIYVPCELIDVLMHELSIQYSEEKWKIICALSPVHKLSYKFDQFRVDTKTKGTFYDVLINDDKLC